MDANYTYNGELWAPSPTVADKNSFFHGAFGVRNEESETYFDKQATVRRKRWADFLTHFKNETMPPPLTDMLKKCLSATLNYKKVSTENKNQLDSYVQDIIDGGRGVDIEEIPVIATLENIEIVLFINDALNPIILKPKIEILGSFLNASRSSSKVVLSLNEGIFQKLKPIKERPKKKLKTEHTTLKDESLETGYIQQPSNSLSGYIKTGCAGARGIKFQVTLLAMFMLKAFWNQLDKWKLSTENKKGGKFDDVLLEWSEGAIFLQAKYTQNTEKDKITWKALMSTNKDNNHFSLPKYFQSYIDRKGNSNDNNLNVILCTTRSFNRTVKSELIEKHPVDRQCMLYHEGGNCFYYTFKEGILPELTPHAMKYLNNKDKVTEENLRDFLKHLQFYTEFPAEKNLEAIINGILCQINFDRPVTFSDVYAKVMDWYLQKDGTYLTKKEATAIFLEIWRDKYLDTLKQYKVNFQDMEPIFQQSDRVVHIVTEDGYFLQELKLCRSLEDKSKETLYLKSDDSVTVQRQVIESFKLPQYVTLIVVWPKFSGDFANRVCEELKNILNQHSYKKLVFVTDGKNERIAQIHDHYRVVNGSVVFGDFSKDTREALLKKDSVLFQGRSISLEELFINQTIQEYDNVFGSTLLEKMIKGEKIRVGLPVLELDKNIDQFYINRLFQKEGKSISEEEMFKLNEKLILISGVAGMGKSTTITNLATSLKRTHPNWWIIRIELNHYTEILKSSLEKNATAIDVIELLNSKRNTRFENQLEKYVFNLKDKVVLILDGIDEISPNYTKLMLSILSECLKRESFAKIVVTTRPDLNNILETELKQKPFELQPFSEDGEIKFLTNYWVSHLELGDGNKDRCDSYARALINVTKNWMRIARYKYNNLDGSFAGVPLQARMLAEIFQENNQSITSTNWDGCKEYIIKNGAEPKLPEQMNVVELYEIFIQKKHKIFMDKNNPFGNIVTTDALEKKLKDCDTDSQNLAWEVIFGETKCKAFPVHQKIEANSRKDLLKIGVVQEMNNELYFIHRTFAEYFVAKSLVNGLGSENVEFQKLLIDEVLLSNQYSMICSFLDYFLQKDIDKLPCNIFKEYQSLNAKLDVQETLIKSNLIFNLAENGFVRILNLILKCTNFKIIKDKEISVKDHIQIIIFSNTLNILQDLVSQAGVNITNSSSNTPLHIASERGHLEMVKLLVNHGANIECRDFHDNTPLNLSLCYNHFEVMKYLVEQGANIQSKNKYGHTVGYLSTLNENQDFSSFLLNHILKNQHEQDLYNSIIPFMAAYLGRLDILRRFIKNGLKVNELFEDEPLIFFAVWGCQLETIKYLKVQGADINTKDRDGNTILHMATVRGQSDIVNFLVVECRLSSIICTVFNKFEYSAMDLALLFRYQEIVKIFEENNGIRFPPFRLPRIVPFIFLTRYDFSCRADIIKKEIMMAVIHSKY